MIWVPVSGLIVKTPFFFPSFSTTIIYVGGTGPNNFTTIQEAIYHASTGDTVFVYDNSSPYFEHVIVNVSIKFIGENKNTTIIDGGGSGDVVLLLADDTALSGFTIQHSGDTPKVDAGVESHGNRVVIQGNIICKNGQYGIGILLNGTSDALIKDNFISENGNEGIFLWKSENATIQENEIAQNGHCAIVISESTGTLVIQNMMYDNYAGISLWPASKNSNITYNYLWNQTYSGIGIWPEAADNIIHNNVFINNSLYGLIMTKTKGNVLAYNTIEGSNEGLRLNMANDTIIECNNFIANNNSAFFENSSLNRWKQNYWDDRIFFLPKCIPGLMRIPWNKMIVIRWINIDWFPARNPYVIYLRGDL
ncbi:MAG: right-handed parallel beta-helix repeat-containing protein [Candidatus Thermoplasmatota archaeon]|nr:right-handed parallel beta-helix repeat-containing protein [Candidatus Thermoplasmatota archaeon]